MWLHMDLIKGVMKSARETYKSVSYAWASVPTYPSGQIGFILCSDDENVDFSVPKRRFSVQDEKAKCRYYHSRVHAASFVLPQFAASALA